MKVRTQATEVKRLQTKRGGWDDDMEKVKQLKTLKTNLVESH